MLAALGFNRKTHVFVAGSQIYGGRSRLVALTSLYPKLVTKENLLTSTELEPFMNFSSQVIIVVFIGFTVHFNFNVISLQPQNSIILICVDRLELLCFV